MTRLLRIKMAVAGVLGEQCIRCRKYGVWSWWRTANYPEARILQVGHPNGRKWSIRSVNQLTRWSRYLREALANKVQAECGPCNRKHGGSIRYKGCKDKTRQGAKRRDPEAFYRQIKP